MRLHPFLFIAFATLTLTLAPSARAGADNQTPAQMIANIENLQTQIAQGDMASYAVEPKALNDLAAAFAAAKPDVWRSAPNVDAVVVYLLSGGRARPIAHLLDSGEIPKADENVVRGALAYVVGQEETAERLLGNLNPMAFDHRVASHLAFVQSILITTTDKAKAVALLDLARLLVPGGLVEEAALRREILLLAEMRDVDRFLVLTRQYMNRYSHSVYADAFLRSLPLIVSHFELANELVDFQKFDRFPASFTQGEQRDLFLTIAHAALVSGKVDVVRAAARKVLALARVDRADETRGRFYQAASRILSDKYDLGVTELRAIDAKKLPDDDVLLLRAIGHLARHLHDVSKIDGPSSSDNSGTESAKPGPEDPATKTIQVAEAAIASTDAFLNGISR